MTKILKSVTVVLLTLLSLPAHAEEVEIDGIYYDLEITDTQATATVIRGSNGYTGDVVIPKSIVYNDLIYFVTTIRSEAFWCCEHLLSVDIPNSVTEIGEWAFYNCYNLTFVDIPNSVTRVGKYAFVACWGLTSVNIPNSVTEIGEGAFKDCQVLNSVNIPDGIKEIGAETFYGCYRLSSVNIPNSVEKIGKEAFMQSGLTAITIPTSVTEIGEEAFRMCSDLTSIDIPSSVTQIGEGAFCDCGLTSVSIPNSITEIREGTFCDCSDLTSIVIPTSVTKISDRAFAWCHSLVSLAIPNSVTSIGYWAFKECYNLTSVVSAIEEPLSLDSDAFESIPSTCTLTVPYGKREAYIAAGWTEDIFGGGIVEATTVLDENSEKMPIAEADAKVCVKRSINADEWSTIVLPFDMTEEQVKEAFGDDVQLADFAGYETIGDAGEVTCIQVNFNAATSIKANTPCLIKVGMDISEFMVEGVNVVPEEKPLVEAVPSTESQWSKMVGCYVAGTQVEKNCLFLSGNKFWYSTGATKMKGYRAYFDFSDILSSVENAEAKVRFAIDGTTTGVESVEFGARKENGSWYSLDGRRLTGKPTEKGIYIVDSKKVAIN